MPAPHTSTPVVITYAGGPTTIIEVAGLRFLTDPTFDGPGRHGSGPVTLEKTEGPALLPSEIGHIDAVLLSHDQHADNLDVAGRALIAGLLTVTTAVAAKRLGGLSVGLAPWESRDFPAPDGTMVRVTATPARHGPPGIEELLGDVIGFVISIANPARDLVYVTGDTVWFDGIAEVAKKFNPAVIVLFAGAARTRGPFHLTMDTNDALEVAAAFPSASIVPVHHSGWAHYTESQDDLVKAFAIFRMSERLLPVSPSASIAIVPPDGFGRTAG